MPLALGEAEWRTAGVVEGPRQRQLFEPGNEANNEQGFRAQAVQGSELTVRW